jgi:hypothetical protein
MDHDILKKHTTSQLTTHIHTSTPHTAPVVYTAGTSTSTTIVANS